MALSSGWLLPPSMKVRFREPRSWDLPVMRMQSKGADVAVPLPVIPG